MTSALFSLQGKAIVITGGLGQLGREYTKATVEAGGHIACLDMRLPEKPDYPADQVLYLQCDITSRTALEEALAAITNTFGIPFGLINNAALDSPPDALPAENGPFETYPESAFDKVMDVNVKGAFLSCQIFGSAMAQAGRGSIINISSIYGVVAPDQSLYEYRRQRGEMFFKPAAYGVSKSALLNLTRYLGVYWAKSGVRVNTLVLAGVRRQQEQAFLNAYEQRIPIGRMAHADEYNGTIIYLLSDASRYMTGATVTVDGGWTAW